MAVVLGVCACSVIPERPYREHVQWPLVVPQPRATRAPAGAPVLLVRDVRAAPGLETHGLQVLRPDGSLFIDLYQEWAVSPAAGTTELLRDRLAGAGLFAAVLAPGSRAEAGLVLETTLTALIAEPGHARASLTILLIDRRAGADRVVLQDVKTGTAPLAGNTPAERVAALRAALGDALGQVVQALAAADILPARRVLP